MSNKYEILENEVNNIDTITNWNDKVNKITQLKEQIITEQERLNKLTNMITKNELDIEITSKKKRKMDLDTLLKNFNECNLLDEKIKLYYLINLQITEIEKNISI